MSQNYQGNGMEIAVIGMAGRFPGAKNVEQFWENLKDGIESITFFSEEELMSTGFSTDLLDNPNYIKCGGGLLDNIEYFDAGYFGYSPVEAELMDPQIRIFHECVWHALENAGYDPFSYDKLIGIYAGANRNIHWEAVSFMSGKSSILGYFATQLLHDKDFLCTRISYNLNLKGPAVVVKTACSTSLVAVHMACQSILNGECDMALAGGVSITRLIKAGYMYQEGMISSGDGHCRAFDENSLGTVGGSGAGVVVLKHLEEASADNDTILAVIKGSAINNDGYRKAGFTAPSVDGQCEVICDALQIAGVDPETVTCVETHGTGTSMGDSIEFEALKLAFNTPKKQYCRIGSVKTNVGHLDTAAGISGFIKTVLALKHHLIPPSLHFETPSSRIDFENSPFIVNTQLFEWKNTGHPLRAGISSFGIGGTNAHVILEEWPDAQCAEGRVQSPRREYQLISLSAKTQAALDRMTENLALYLKENKDTLLADAAYTLQLGRRTLPHRRIVVCPDIHSAVTALSSPGAPGASKVRTSHAKEEKKSIIFMFPGLGAQYVHMGLGLYRTEPVFHDQMNHCFDILHSIGGYDLKAILYPDETGKGNSKPSTDLHRPEVVQPVLFSFEYALARLLMHWGIKPHAMIGYSLGEYTAACLSGVFSLEDALKVIVTRGKRIGTLPTALMLSVPFPKEDLKPFLTGQLSIAIDNGPSCIVAGPGQELVILQNELKKQRCLCFPLPNSHALHSPMMNPILEDFETDLKNIPFNNPQIPYISNITGDWITTRDATNPGYWVKHLKETVRFADGIKQLMKEFNPIFVEIGPGRDLNTLLVRHKEEENHWKYRTVNLIKPAQNKTPDDCYFLNKLGLLWTYGVNIDWKEFYKGEQRFRIPLPLYPFEGRSYYIDANPMEAVKTMMDNSLPPQKKDTGDWLYTQQWFRTDLIQKEYDSSTQIGWLLFIQDSPLCNRWVKRLEQDNHHVVVVKIGESFHECEPDEYTVNPGKSEDYESLFRSLVETGKTPDNIAHLWCLPGSRKHNPDLASPDPLLDLGLFSLLGIARGIEKANISEKIQLGVITGNMQYVTGEEELYPEKAALLGPVKIIPLEYTNIYCRSIDITNPGEDKGKIEFIIQNLLREFSTGFNDQPVVAYRGACRWYESFQPIAVDKDKSSPKKGRLKEKGVYLVTGGFGGMGFVLAEHLVKTLNAKLILVDIITPPTGEKLDPWLYSDERKKDIQSKKQKIKEWESHGGKILVNDMDVSNYQGMKKVISQAEKQFGHINGVVHAAGLIDYAGVIRRRTREMTEALLAAKIKGTLVLDQLLSQHQLDFMVLFSSIGNVFYKVKFGQVGYNAGHEFMDIFSYYKQQLGQFTVTIDWNDWAEVGMAVRAAKKNSPPNSRKESESLLSISPAEGIDVFHSILEHNVSRVAVSHHDLPPLIVMMNNPAEQVQTGSFDAEEQNTVELHERPELSSDYVPPSNELEQFIIDIWEKILGFKKIGIMDDWFELGGDSLIVTQLISRIREVYPVEISVNIFFENPTIAGLAEMIKELLYEKIQDLSEEEVDALMEQDAL
ncbi:MAG: SDR family NAD(P)-dependent oxidoreductase [Candidatus Aminicenantes bacterium]|jgi:acyl transferase domain-containing protein/acyl carrier protein